MNRFLLGLTVVGTLIVGVAGPAKAANVALGKAYAYEITVPGQPGIHYLDDPLADIHDVHTLGLGVFDTGDLTDNMLQVGAPGGLTQPVVAIRGPNANAPAANVIIDLAGSFLIDRVELGTDVESGLNNNAPDDVTISFSNDNVTYFSAEFFDLEASFGPLANARFDLNMVLSSSVTARYVKFGFNGGSMAEPGGSDPDEKYIMDELRVFGEVAPGGAVPEPSSFALAALGLLGLGFYGWRRRKRE